MFIVELINNLAILVALSILAGAAWRRWPGRRGGGLLAGLLFGAAVVIGMLQPLVFGPGLHFDGRSVMLSLCALFFGPLAALVAGGMAVAVRLVQGGAGVYMGVAVILSSLLIGLAFRSRRRPGPETSIWHLLLLGLAVHVAMLACTVLLPGRTGLDVLERIGLTVLTAYPLATVLIGKVLSDQAERAAAVEALRESNEYLENLFNYANAPIIVWDPHFRITRFNHAFEALTGLRAAQVIGRELPVLFPPEQVEASMALIRRTLEGERWETVEIGIRHQDGAPRTVLWNSANIIDREGRVVATIAQGYDITRRKQAEENMRRLEIQLRQEQKLAAVGTLANGVAHEINNPLTGVINFAQLAIDRLPPGAEQVAEFCGQIILEGNRIAGIVRNLLVFSRQEQVVHAPEDLGEVTRSILSLTEKLFAKDEIELATEVAPGLPAVRCSSPQIQQVLLNLLTNARDALNERYPGFHRDKRVLIAVAPLADGAGQWVRVTVHDHGGGIPAAARERLFDPFFTTKDRSHGTGLGLSISYGIVQDHGGRLSFETAEGESSSFHMDLPVLAGGGRV